MKSKDVLKILRVTRPTLTAYIKSGKITGKKLANGSYDYDEESIYAFIGKPVPTVGRKNVIYARVSTAKQKQDLANQVLQLIDYCNEKDICCEKVYQEVASGIDFDRKQFNDLIEAVTTNTIKNIYITYKDRISRLSFMTLENLFKKFNTNIIVINDKSDNNDEDDLFEELLGVIHLFSMKTYSSRRKQFKKKIHENLI